MGCTIPGCGSSGHNRRTHDKHVPPGDPLDPTRFLVGEHKAEIITHEQAERLWPGRVVVEDDGSWSMPVVSVQGTSSVVENEEDPPDDYPGSGWYHGYTAGQGHSDIPGKAESGNATPDQADVEATFPAQAEALEIIDRVATADALSAVEAAILPATDEPIEHECEPTPGQVYFCRHCGEDLMVEDDAPEPWITPPWRTVLGPDEPIRITQPGVYELTAEEYHSFDVTGDWFSNSDAKALLASCPAQFDYDRRNAVRKISDAFDFGHVWHAVILGKGEAYQVFEPKKLDGRTGPGKEQKAAVDAARAAGITPIYGDQFKLIEAMAEAVKADPVPHALLTAPGRSEVCLFWYQPIKVTDPHNKLYGQTVTVQRRAMIDHLPDMPEDPRETVRLADGKTADHVKPDDDMRKKIYDYAYHRQAETYAAAVEALFNRDAEVTFIFQSKKPPHLITPVDLDTPAMRVAAAQNREAMEIWAECVATGDWYGYTKGVETSGVPTWIERRYEDQIGEM